MARPDVVAVAATQLNYVEGGGADGRSGNLTRYWADLDPSLQGEPWCAAFVSWVYRQAGSPLPAVDRPYGFILVNDGYRYAKAHNELVTMPEPGDIVLYRMGQGHTGIFEKWSGAGEFLAIEGNTSPGHAGSQTNGGGVYRRVRSTDLVLGFWRPATQAPVPAPTAPAPSQEDDPMNLLIILAAGAQWLWDVPNGKITHIPSAQDSNEFQRVGVRYVTLTDDQWRAFTATYGAPSA